MTSAAPDVDGAVRAIKLGAYHFLTKDADPDVLRELVRHAGERQDLHRHVLTLQDAAGDAGGRDFITGPSTGAEGRARDGAQGREALGDRADPRRKRHRQGAARAAAASRVGESRRAVHRRQRRRDSARAGREHAVRPREGLVHRRAAAAHRQVRARQRRHAVPRRDRRSEAGSAGQAAARDPGRRGRARRRLTADPHPVPADRRDQRRSRARREGRRRSARTSTTASTSSRCGCRRCASASRTCRCSPTSSSSRYSARFHKDVRGIAESTLAMLSHHSLAGQHPRAREPDRAARRGGRSRIHHRRGSAVRISRRGAGSHASRTPACWIARW